MTTAKASRTIIIEYEDKHIERITVPANAKVTFGKLFPGKPGDYRDGSENLYLRIYKTQGEQLAVFPGVKRFWDTSLDRQMLGASGEWIPVDEETMLGGAALHELIMAGDAGPGKTWGTIT